MTILVSCDARSDFFVTSSSSMHCSIRMMFNLLAMMVASFATFFSSAAETATSASGTVDLHVTTTSDVETVPETATSSSGTVDLHATTTSDAETVPETATCASGTVEIHVTTTSDVQTVMDELNCAGPGTFNITWHSSLQIEQRIDASNQKNITITGSGSPVIHGAPVDNNNAEPAADTATAGIFSVSSGSILRLCNLTLEAGNALFGGAVSVSSSSSLFVFGCTFASNTAADYGGEISSVETGLLSETA